MRRLVPSKRRSIRGRWLTLTLLLTGCVSEPAVTLPSGTFTASSGEIVINTAEPLSAPVGLMRGGIAVDGTATGLHPDFPDLRDALWWHSDATDEPDGAHVRLVRVSPDDVCRFSLSRVISKDASIDDPTSWDRALFDQHVRDVVALNSAGVHLHVGFGPVANCGRADQPDPTETPDAWAQAAVAFIDYAIAPTDAESPGLAAPVVAVELLGDPRDEFGVAETELMPAFELYATIAQAVAERWPVEGDDAARRALAIVSPSFQVNGLDDYLRTEGDTPHPVRQFLDFVESRNVPLDRLAVKLQSEGPEAAADLMGRIRRRLDDAGLGNVGLVVTGVEVTPIPLEILGANVRVQQAYRGAQEMSTRLLMQDVPVSAVFSSPTQDHFSDGLNHGGEALSALDDLRVRTPYFDETGVATPAFTASLPLRQVHEHPRVEIVGGAARRRVVVNATQDPDRSDRTHVIVSSLGTSGDVPYVLRLTGRNDSGQVAYLRAVLDATSVGNTSFVFTDIGELSPDAESGDVIIARNLQAPAVHYFVFESP